ncbi:MULTISPECIES: 3-oxoacyl-ACP synthase III family protein [Protofrankia]|uniref:3-oxoacyl-ACP synthase n=1 Tax=Protofrankia coriariae TaxID=1562887 RepID=A0ABR5F3Q6_9ACTN|nr:MULTISPECIES: 3-oxoacyl-ACP synthase III family protein [Protofrankia]KLL11317.1 3-oxoacyl-ACP synthase [Protofrankia coriariae]ONH34858.1 3-oxoacyl-ACP synthase [Protofrankia sp. BMG5.30]
MTPPDVHLAAVGTALPGPPVDNAALARRFGMDPIWEEWVDTFIGTRTRHLAVDLDTGEVRYSLADLGETAGRQALETSGFTAEDIDLVVMGTATPDHLMPATVNVVADRLGIDGVSTYQLQSGCAGAFQALDVARQMLLTGRHRTALVLGGDVIAKHYDLELDLRSLPPAEMVNVALFGDGAGAVVLTTEPRGDSTALRTVFTRLTGLRRAPGQILEWFGPAQRQPGGTGAREDYKAIEASVPVMAEEILAELLKQLGWSSDEVDYVLPPQLSGTMTARIMARLDVPGMHEVTCVNETGNNANALPFQQLERVLPQLADGDRVLGIAVESSKWIQAGFALEKV